MLNLVCIRKLFENKYNSCNDKGIHCKNIGHKGTDLSQKKYDSRVNE